MKTGKFLPGGSQDQKTYFLGQKVKNAICDGTLPDLIYISAGKCRGDKSSNKIELSQFIQVLLHFSDLRPPWLLWVYGWVGVGVNVSAGCPSHVLPCMHTHTHAHTWVTLKYTCIEIANGWLHGGIHVYHV